MINVKLLYTVEMTACVISLVIFLYGMSKAWKEIIEEDKKKACGSAATGEQAGREAASAL